MLTERYDEFHPVELDIRGRRRNRPAVRPLWRRDSQRNDDLRFVDWTRGDPPQKTLTATDLPPRVGTQSLPEGS